MQERDLRRKKYWTLSLLWTVLIYTTLSFARDVSEFLRVRVPFGLGINILLGIMLGAVLFYALLKIKDSWKRKTAVIALGCLYVVSAYFIKYPEEKIHFVEYGVLAYFIFNALSVDFKLIASASATFFLTAMIGLGDEGIQHILPKRYFDWNDVILNAYSGGLGTILTIVSQRKKEA